MGGLLSSPSFRPMKRSFNFAVGNRFTDGLITIIAIVLLVVFLREPKPPKISIHQAAKDGNIEAVKQDLADGTDVNAKDNDGDTPLSYAKGQIADLIRKHGGKTGKKLEAAGN